MNPLRDLLLRQYDDVQRGTRRLMQLVPESKLDWAPHSSMFTLRELLAHQAGIAEATARGVILGHWTRPDTPPGFSKSDALSRLEASIAQTQRMFNSLSDAEFEHRVVRMPWGAEMTVARAFAALIEHDIHHRTQLFLYLKQLDLDVTTLTLFG